MELPAFVKSVSAEKRWRAGTTEFTHEEPVYTVVFTVSPYFDERCDGSMPLAREGMVTSAQELKVIYDTPPPFVAGELVPLCVGDRIDTPEPRRDIAEDANSPKQTSNERAKQSGVGSEDAVQR
jgi:hypothetical protein